MVQAYIMYNQSSFECLYITLDTGFIVFRVPGGIAGLSTSGDPNSNGMSSNVFVSRTVTVRPPVVDDRGVYDETDGDGMNRARNGGLNSRRKLNRARKFVGNVVLPYLRNLVLSGATDYDYYYYDNGY